MKGQEVVYGLMSRDHKEIKFSSKEGKTDVRKWSELPWEVGSSPLLEVFVKMLKHCLPGMLSES